MGLHLVLMGAPGAGKGTQGMRIAESRKVPHISTGEIFRQHIERGDELGKMVQPYMHNGHLAPDDLAVTVMTRRLKESDCAGGYVLDGFPRSIKQAESFKEMMEARGESLSCVINIVVNDEEIVERLSARRFCPLCGAIYNLKFNRPKAEGICDNPACAGARLVHREDDFAETVRERLRVYHNVTEPILGFYRNAGLLHDVKGMGSTPDQIFAIIDGLITKSEAA